MHIILHDLIVLLDETGTITATNAKWEQQLPDTTGLNFLQVYKDAARTPDTKKIRQAIQKIITGEISTFSYRFHMAELRFAMQLSALEDQGDTRILVSLRDITDILATSSQQEDQQQLAQLSETNIALNSLLKSREQDRATLEGAIASNVTQLIMPYVERLENGNLPPDQQTLVTIIKGYLDNLISPFMHRMSTINQQLTPQELKVASLIRQGRSSKEIGAALNLTVNGVGFHRKSIRTKLGLTGSGKNLRSQLMALQ